MATDLWTGKKARRQPIRVKRNRCGNDSMGRREQSPPKEKGRRAEGMGEEDTKKIRRKRDR